MASMGTLTQLLYLAVCIYCVSSAVSLIRWCTISGQEQTKCIQMQEAFAAQSLTPLQCITGEETRDCLSKIQSNQADLITLDGGDVYVAGREFGMVPIMKEVYEKDPDGYHAIAVVKTTNTDININNLRGKKSCHTGVKKTAGWNVPVGYLLENGLMNPTDCQDDIGAAGIFFSQSCAPGAKLPAYDPLGTNSETLCELCKGNCTRDDDEPYYGYKGAFRCLVENAGDVAFIKPATIAAYTGRSSQEDWAINLEASDFQLLCPDGSRASVENYRTCNLAFVPPHAVMTSSVWEASVLQDFRSILNQAQELFGEDVNPNGFSMFDSGEESDLLFKDSAINLQDVIDEDYIEYLGGDYIETLKGLEKCPEDTLRWCVTSSAEKRKCTDMKTAFEVTANLSPVLSCFQSQSALQCASDIADGEADLVSLDGGELYTAGRDNKVAPIMAEDYGSGDVSYWAVVVVKRSSTFTINDLRGLRSCHTGYMRTAGWVVPIGFLINRGEIRVNDECEIPMAVGDFFSVGCAPGIKDSINDPTGDNPDNMCQQCAGVGANKCKSSGDEPYSSYHGAFRCLVEDAGDVAFVKHSTVGSNTNGANQDAWAVGLDKADYQLLCPDGSRAEVDNYLNCNLAKVPSHTVVTAVTKTTAERQQMVTLLTDGQSHFKEDSSTQFSMFQSDYSDFPGNKNLLFKDSTVELLPTGAQDTYDKFLSEEYLNDVAAMYCEQPATGDDDDDAAGAISPSVVVMIVALVIALIRG